MIDLHQKLPVAVTLEAEIVQLVDWEVRRMWDEREFRKSNWHNNCSALGLAIIQAGLAIMFFMHLRAEKRNLLLFLAIGTIFVLGMMNMIWSDSFRLLHMRPFSS